MRTILLYLSYDGRNFCGWQSQRKINEERTVQGELEKALLKVHKTKVLCQGSGRTDSGVHARRQAVSFDSPLRSIPVEKYPMALNAFLPIDIRVQSAHLMPSGFSARFNATSRSYRYFLSTSQSPSAFSMPYSWALYRKPNILLLNAMASLLHGEMDCASFASSGDKSLSTKRYIYTASFFMEDEMLVFEISANAFLWKMIRSLVGSLIDFEKRYGDNAVEEFQKLIDLKDRRKAGQTAPPQGLFMWDVSFEGERVHP
ncbi:MAG TPA: tRNA pseudouridine(38-40) synthase TruA [Treponemataceae bacterium]|jgi:tRNA pseudouridine38-40 synthase|nr:tRNA pseudouridine(38-40) synthase TruA [Treponemataceae bacterium]